MGRPARITPEARAWVVSLACVKPRDLGCPEELWTTVCWPAICASTAGRPGAESRATGPGHDVEDPAGSRLRPHKIEYLSGKARPGVRGKDGTSTCDLQLVQLARERKEAGEAPQTPLTVFVSYDEKPGIQASAGSPPTWRCGPGRHAATGRDYEYRRLGTLTLLAGLHLLTGHIHRAVVERHSSREFVAFLRQLDAAYPAGGRIRLVLDNHSAHVSKETRKYLATTADRFEFVFTPVHGWWLNLVESFFAKLTNSLLRGMRVRDDGRTQAADRTLHRPA